MNNLFLLQRSEQCLALLHEQLKPMLVDASLTPTLFNDTYTLNCVIKNVYKEEWMSEKDVLEAAVRIGTLLGLNITPGAIVPAPRDPGLFIPYKNVEVLDYWICHPSYKEDELCRDPEAARMLVRVQPDVVWGWCPGHVLETVGSQIKVRLQRQLFREGASGGYFASLSAHSWGIRLVKGQEVQEGKSGEPRSI